MATPTVPPVTVEGVFHAHHRSANGWCAGRIHTNDGDTILCTLVHHTNLDGVRIRGKGYWVTYRNRKELRLTEVEPINPHEALVQILARTVDGLGTKRAEAILEQWGDAYGLYIGDEEELQRIPGIGPRTARRIAQSWNAQKTNVQGYAGLSALGLSVSQSINVYRQWGTEPGLVEERLRTNPYQILEIDGIGWETADSLARRLGVTDPNDPRRLDAAAVEAIRILSQNGNTLHERAVWLRTTRRLVPSYPAERLPETDELYITADGAIALTEFAQAEEAIARRLKAIRPIPLNGVHESFRGLSDTQKAALLQITRHDVGVLIGPAGTGKTHTLAALVRYYWSKEASLQCLAPTARAAINLADRTGVSASTIHMAIIQRTLPYAEIIIIEEASMLPTGLMRRILDQNPNATLILAGDPLQLPPVEPGQVLRDILRARSWLPIAELTEIMRHDGHLRDVAMSVRHGNWDFESIGAVRVCEHGNPISEAIAQRLRLRDQKNVVVLSALRREVATINETLQKELNPNPPRRVLGGHKLAIGDPIRQTRNNYRLDVFNGQIGYVTWIADDAHDIPMEEWDKRPVVRARFEQGEIEYTVADLDITLAYAITIHAAQGGEWDSVIGIVPWHEDVRTRRNWLTRELLYTMMTRAREALYLFGHAASIDHFRYAAAPWHERHTLLGRLLQ